MTISHFFTSQSPTKTTKRNKEQKRKPQQQQTPGSLFEQKSFKTLHKEMAAKGVSFYRDHYNLYIGTMNCDDIEVSLSLQLIYMKLHLEDNLLKCHHSSCSRPPPNTAKQNAHDESSKTLGNIFSPFCFFCLFSFCLQSDISCCKLFFLSQPLGIYIYIYMHIVVMCFDSFISKA